MKRYFVVMIILFLSVSATILTLAEYNPYKVSDYAYEHRITDHEGDDPFEYERVSQNVYDVDGPRRDQSGVYDRYYESVLWSQSTVDVSQYYNDSHHVSCSTTVGYNRGAQTTFGSYYAEAILYHAVQKGLTLDPNYHQRTFDNTNPDLNSTFSGYFRDWAFAFGSFTDEMDPIASLEFCSTFGRVRAPVTEILDAGGPIENLAIPENMRSRTVTYNATSRASVNSEWIDVTIW